MICFMFPHLTYDDLDVESVKYDLDEDSSFSFDISPIYHEVSPVSRDVEIVGFDIANRA